MRRGNYGIDPERLARLVAEQAEARAARIAERLRLGALKAAATRAAKRDAEFLERANRRKVEKQAARGRKATDPVGALAGWKLLACAMSPGSWYALPDLVALMPAAPRGSIKAWVYQKLVNRGLTERAANPDWDPARAARQQVEPRYLWRLTQEGAEARSGWVGELGAVEGDRASVPLLGGLDRPNADQGSGNPQGEHDSDQGADGGQ
jgi:hypothetical protein